MKLYNKSGRSFILDPKNVISGGRYQDHDRKKEKCYFDPEKQIEIKEDAGAKMLLDYPTQLMRVDAPTAAANRAATKYKRSRKPLREKKG